MPACAVPVVAVLVIMRFSAFVMSRSVKAAVFGPKSGTVAAAAYTSKLKTFHERTPLPVLFVTVNLMRSFEPFVRTVPGPATVTSG